MSQSPHFRGTPHPVGEVISNSGKTVGTLFCHARALARLDSLLSGYLDPDTATQIQVANFDQNRLVLITPSASRATRIRLQATEILGFLEKVGYSHIRELEIHVAPLQRPQKETRIRRQSSAAADEALKRINLLVSSDNS